MQTLALAAATLATAAGAWLLIQGARWPADRPPSGPAASLAGVLLVLGAGSGGAAVWVLAGARRAAVAGLVAAFTLGLVVLIAAVVLAARVGGTMRGTAALRYPDPVTGSLLGGGVGLAALALAGGLAAVVLDIARLAGRTQPRGALAWALVPAVVALAAGADALRQAVPVLRAVQDNERLSRGQSPFRADR